METFASGSAVEVSIASIVMIDDWRWAISAETRPPTGTQLYAAARRRMMEVSGTNHSNHNNKQPTQQEQQRPTALLTMYRFALWKPDKAMFEVLPKTLGATKYVFPRSQSIPRA
jgi:hypothetical protein